MTVQLMQECNAKAEQIGKSIMLDITSDNEMKKARARRKLMVMIGMQRTMIREIVELYRNGITFDAWKELYFRVNSQENAKKIDNAQGEMALICKIALEQGDHEAYYNQVVLRISKEEIAGLEASLPHLAMFEQQVKNAIEGK